MTQNLPDGDEILLGKLLSGKQQFQMIAGVLSIEDFPDPTHQHIFRSMAGIHERGGTITTVTVANELMQDDLLESCGGLSYLVGLDNIGRTSYEQDV